MDMIQTHTINSDGTKSWHAKDGRQHKVKFGNGLVEYWQNHQRHRTDGPAVIRPDGTQEWYQNHQRHRTDGPALIWPDGTQGWYQNGRLHRTDGPAVIYPDGSQGWYQNGHLHRTDGPAVIRPDGTQEWWINGREITNEIKKWIASIGALWPWDQDTHAEFALTWM